MIVREFTKVEFDVYASIRRLALATNPEAFGDSIAKLDARGPEEEQQRFRASVDTEDHLLLGAFDSEDCIGMAGLRRDLDSNFHDRAIVWGVFVDPNSRGSRVGDRLIQKLKRLGSTWDWLAKIVLSVKSDNSAAIRVYERNGFEAFQPGTGDPILKGP